jgi:uncharacterized protein YndB with AHSA1/START domain
MQRLRFSTVVNAPRAKVWNTMLEDGTYRQWTSVFNPAGSYYEGEWTTGSDIRFLGPNEDGTVSGMLATVKEARPHEFISIQHLGELGQGKETRDDPQRELFENYTFAEQNGSTELVVDVDVEDNYKPMFEEMWPKALARLKALAEDR